MYSKIEEIVYLEKLNLALAKPNNLFKVVSLTFLLVALLISRDILLQSAGVIDLRPALIHICDLSSAKSKSLIKIENVGLIGNANTKLHSGNNSIECCYIPMVIIAPNSFLTPKNTLE
ncbi:hypothetical protein [Pedobacter foliorum]|uniref:hypothetical protein n=1 Tax=Pedobacter foliorum TaxID=2739058 RepID=UPI00156505CF|nr:hypothetical protein [Pedobacter foliorum]NRF40183.1 hypothetical protein [Pedobacter foliorum]